MKLRARGFEMVREFVPGFVPNAYAKTRGGIRRQDSQAQQPNPPAKRFYRLFGSFKDPNGQRHFIKFIAVRVDRGGRTKLNLFQQVLFQRLALPQHPAKDQVLLIFSGL